eukprot:gene7031-7095_t
MIPTVFGIMLLTFIVVQFAPGGPVERIVAQLQGLDSSATSRFGGAKDIGSTTASSEAGSKYRGAQGLDPKLIAELEKQFGFDKPAYERFFLMVKNYAVFDFGKSFYRDTPVISLIREKLPVSMTLGLWMTLISYAISIPLGITKAVRDGSRFDVWTSAVIIVGYAVPGFLFAILLIVLFAGGSFWQIFPLRGLTSEGWANFTLVHKMTDYLWHIALPIFAMSISSFATTTFLTKNSFLDEIRKQYVQTARMKGLNERQVLYGHVFRNAMLIVIAGFPSAFVHAFFTGSLLIEFTFSLDGLGLLSYEAIVNRDYAVVFATLYIFSLMGLVVGLLSDLILSMASLAPSKSLAPPLPAKSLSPMNQRRFANFKANRRGYWAFWIFGLMFVLSLFAEFIANDRPVLARYKGEWLMPVLFTYEESKFGGFLAQTDYRDPVIANEINAHGWMVWPPVRFADNTHNYDVPTPVPSPPTWSLSDDICRTAAQKKLNSDNPHLNLIFQRFIEIWSSLPTLYVLIILSSIITPSFFVLLGILLTFSWVALVHVVRAEFLRARNFEYVNAARALGLSNARIMWKHVLPNAMVATLTFMPFILNGSITTLTSLDFLGFGLPPGSPSLGELLLQGRANLNAPWLGITGFMVIALMLSLLIFIGEAVRDAFDPRKTLG